MSNSSLNFKPIIFLTLFILCSRGSLLAQDPRVSQYRSMPLLINPAHTGDFEGKLRVIGLYARLDDDVSHNNFYNGSLDWRIGQRGRWALGLNYLQTGSSTVPMSGKNTGLSLAREFFLDKHKFQELRLGFQASYIYGSADETKATYNRLIDTRTFRLWHRPGVPYEPFKGSDSYLNYSVGAKYNLTLERLKIETGFSAYNITNPEYNYVHKGSLLKRYRVSALSSIYYRTDPKNALKFEHFSWKEGIYLRDFKPERDTTEIHETIYSLTWYRYMRNKSFNLGMYSRSWRAVYGMLGVNLNDRVAVNLSYEAPLLKKYYNVSHFEVSLHLYPFGKKKKPEEQRNRELIDKMTAILPFGTTFCLPCLDSKLALNIKIPDSLKANPPVCKDDSLKPALVDTTMLVARPLVPERVPFFYKDTIYYDFDKFNIRKDASLTLNKVSSLMRENSSLSLHIKSYTDLRGSIAYNQTLSRNRANSAKNYLSLSGIDRQKITHSWHGESSPLNNCEKCSDVLQQKNRRSVLYLDGFVYKNIGNLYIGSDTVSQQQLKDRINSFISLEAENLSNSELLTKPELFTIQLTTAERVNYENISMLKGLNPNVFEQKYKNGQSMYFFGVFADRQLAVKKLDTIRNLGFKHAFVKKIDGNK